MKTNKQEEQEILDTSARGPLPRPVPERECACGCGHYFYPRRKDNIYLSKQHADFAYNHGKRKNKNKNRVRCEKILANNDSILDKHFKSEKNSKSVDRFYDTLEAEGYDFRYNTGTSEKNNIDYYYSYNYYYRIFFEANINKVKIFKR